PSVNYSYTNNAMNVSFTDLSTSTGSTTYQWTFGDGNGSSIPNPTHIYAQPGTYWVCLMVTDICHATTFCDSVVVSCPIPASAFTSSATGLAAAFTNNTVTQGTPSWLWTFGDGGVSVVQSPSHTYSQPGTYQVCLRTSDDCGIDTLCQNLTVDTLVGIQGPGLQAIQVYPSPTSGELFVEFQAGAAGPRMLRVYNSLGQEVLKRDLGWVAEGRYELDFGSESEGLYFIEIQGERETTTRKFTISR
ncbi:MAG: PKD domain-containing protein, partial [Bacteroidota bacterium]